MVAGAFGNAFIDCETRVMWAQDHGIKLRFIQPGKPNQNAFVEHFSKSVRTEELNAWLIHSLEQAQEVIED